MSRVAAGQAKLAQSLKNLLEKWEIAQDYWKDSIRTEFEEKHLKELVDQTRSTLSAMDRLAEILARAEKECA
jgi:DNA phosphorothioation-dependent restriction protein DptG